MALSISLSLVAMASFLSLLLFSLISVTFSLSKAFDLPPPKAFHLPIRKDPKIIQYYTSVDVAGNPNVQVVIDLGGQCYGSSVMATTHRPIVDTINLASKIISSQSNI